MWGLLPVLLQAGPSHDAVLDLIPGRVIYSLEHSFVTIDSTSWQEGGDTLRWAVDRGRGRVIILEDPPDTVRLFIRYSYEEDPPPEILSLGLERKPGDTESRKQDTGGNSDRPDRNRTDGIRARGSISRSIQVSSGGQGDIQSDMNIRLSGELAPGVELRGTISENNAVSENNVSSSQLKEIDNIFIQVTSPTLELSFGDVTASGRNSELNRYTKKILGFSGQRQGEKAKLNVFAGSARGTFLRRELKGRNGSQGPYSLTSGSGNGEIYIVPGSETVYLDGEKLPPDDYVIMYREAEITFGSKYLISEESRILVEFTYQDQVYPRSSTGGDVTVDRGLVSFRAGLYRERDDGENPADPVLALMDPDSLKLLVSGSGELIAVETAYRDSSGDYDRIGDIWVYAGAGKGSHTVYFYREDSTGGYARRYDAQGLSYFEFDPEDAGGNYYPRRLIRSPGQLMTGHVGLRIGSRDRRYIEVEHISSSLTANTFSSDVPTRGGLTVTDLKYSLFSDSDLLVLSAKQWRKDEGFESFQPLFAPDFDRQTGLRSPEDLTYSGACGLSSAGKLGQITSTVNYYESSTEKDRGRLQQQIRLERGIPLLFSYSRLFGTDLLPYYDIGLSAALFRFRDLSLSGKYRKEHHEAVFDGLVPEWQRSFTQTLAWKDILSLSYSNIEEREEENGEFLMYSRKNDALLGFTKSGGETFSIHSTVHFRRDERRDGINDYLLGQQRLNLSFPGINSRLQLDNSLNRSSENRREAVYYYVGEGLGAYRWDEDYGEYVPDQLGTHILRYELSAERRDEVVHRSEGNYEFAKTLPSAAGIHVNYTLRGQVEYRAPDFVPFRNIGDSVQQDLYTGQTKLRHDLRLQSPSRKRSLTLSLDRGRQQNTRDITLQQLSGSETFVTSYRWKGSFGSWILDYSYRDLYRLKIPIGSYSIRNYTHKAGLKNSSQVFKSLNISSEYGYSSILTFFSGNFPSQVHDGRVSLRYDRNNRDQIMVEYRYASVASEYEGTLPYEVADGLVKGRNTRFVINYQKQINRSLSMSLQFQSRTREGADDLRLGRLELKAYF